MEYFLPKELSSVAVILNKLRQINSYMHNPFQFLTLVFVYHIYFQYGISQENVLHLVFLPHFPYDWKQLYPSTKIISLFIALLSPIACLHITSHVDTNRTTFWISLITTTVDHATSHLILRHPYIIYISSAALETFSSPKILDESLLNCHF